MEEVGTVVAVVVGTVVVVVVVVVDVVVVVVGGTEVVIEFESLDAPDVPTLFVAVTVNV